MARPTTTKQTSKQSYHCPKTGRRESATVTVTTKTKPSGRSATAPAASFSRSNVVDCSGLDDCGVKEVHGRTASFSWDAYPLHTSLNKG